MDLSYSAQFVALRAEAEAKYAHIEKPGIEFWFLGLLKLSELKGKDVFRLSEKELAQIDEDIASVKEMLKEHEIDSGLMRARLRHVLKHNAKNESDSVKMYLGLAYITAGRRNEKKIWAQDLLKVLLEAPTEILKEYLPERWHILLIRRSTDLKRHSTPATGKK